jgi:long-chain acyl-CoA synthetase
MSSRAGTVDGSFRGSVKRYPQRIFVRRIDSSGKLEEVTYEKAAIRVAATVRKLRELGIQSGEMIACYIDDLHDSMFFWLACFNAGVVPVPVAPSYSINMMRGLAERTAARFYFTAAADVPRLVAEGIRPLSYSDKPSDSIHALPLNPELGFEEAMKILETEGASLGPSTPLLIIPTSGTTGESKLPLWNHQVMEGSADDFLIALGSSRETTDEERYLVATSLTHGLGMTVAFTATCVGGTVCFARRFDVDMTLEDVRALDFSLTFMTPRVLRSLHKQWLAIRKSEDEKLFGPRARIVAFAGAPPDPELMRLLERQGVHGVDVWGTAEAGIKTCTPIGGWREGSVGKPFPKSEVKVAADGELLARNPHMMIGYYKDEALTKEAFTADGFYKTGDAGEIDADGWVRITGRKKDVFNTYEGANIYPGRLEVLIESMPWVKQAFLLGDRLPFIGTLVVVHDPVTSDAPDGYLDPELHPALYERARKDFTAFNEKLEFVEKVRRFALLARPFTENMHQVVTIGKVRRSRAEFMSAYKERIEWLYSSALPAHAYVEPPK